MDCFNIDGSKFEGKDELVLELVKSNNEIVYLRAERDRYRNALLKIMSSCASALDAD